MRRVFIVLAGTAVAALIGWGAMHVFITPVNPAQERPANHFEAPCWTCHLVLESAPVTDH